MPTTAPRSRAAATKVMAKRLADGKYYKRKAVVERVIEKYVGVVRTLPAGGEADDAGVALQIDQDEVPRWRLERGVGTEGSPRETTTPSYLRSSHI